MVGAALVTAREQILARVRAARAGGGATPAPGDGDGAPAYRVEGSLTAQARLALFVDRLQEYGVRLSRCAADDVGAAVASALRARRAAEVVAPEGLPAEWRPAGVTWLSDAPEPLAVPRLAAVDGVVTGCAVAIAETGTLALDGGEGQGRRALTLVPDYHLCVVRADQVVETVPQAVRRLAQAVADGRPITFVSGPSATSDIELSRVAGVHGPRTLDVILVGSPSLPGTSAILPLP